jgi:hypothetical protein
VIEMLALREPVADGVNVTLMLQLCPPPTLPPQVLVCAKSPEFVPVIMMLVMLSAVLPRLVSVTVLAALVFPTLMVPKFRLAGASRTAAPVPVKGTACGLPEALSVTLTAALRVPPAVGSNVTLTVQLAWLARVEGDSGQLSVWLKSPALLPVIATLVMVRATPPVLSRVILCAALVVPTF